MEGASSTGGQGSLIKKVTVEQRLEGAARVGQAGMWGGNSLCKGPKVECAHGDQQGGQNKQGARGGKAREATGDGVYPTDGTEITPHQREEARTFSEALSDAVVRGASVGRAEGCITPHTSEGPQRGL